MPELTFQTSGNHSISVCYASEYDGGGTVFGTRYVDVIKKKYPNRTFNNCLDWCSGPGFIGFNLLDHDICKELHLIDSHQPAIDYAKKTISNLPSKLNNSVKVYQIDNLKFLPAHIMFDLVVANPPHFQTELTPKMQLLSRRYADQLNAEDKEAVLKKFPVIDNKNFSRIAVDAEWQARKNFYQTIKSHLLPNGVILMQENAAGSAVEDFESMIDSSGLEITDVFFDNDYGNFIPTIKIYYIEIKHKLS
jgi:methylase of polypeptide subunit release factors